jgi:hypothetical protein
MGSRLFRRTRIVLACVIALASCVAISAAAKVTSRASDSSGDGAFYVKCPFTHRAGDDPIVFPGEPGRSHLHDFLGNKSTDAFSTPETLARAGTTCKRSADRSAYWIPTLYQDGQPIKASDATANYKSGLRNYPSIVPFPEGFRMIAGDSAARDRQIGHVVDWSCPQGRMVAPGRASDDSPHVRALRAVIADLERAVVRNRKKLRRLRVRIRMHRSAIRRHETRGHPAAKRRVALRRTIRAYRLTRRALRRARAARANRAAGLKAYLAGGGTSIPTCERGAPLQLDVRFPDCWDGTHLDSSDHKSHVAYSAYSRASDRWECPRTHPQLLPKLRLRVEYPTTGGPDVRLSPGDVDAGHADFFNGWDQGKLAELVQTCLRADQNCGNGDVPMKDPAPEPAPSPAPTPSPSPSPSPSPPPPEPDPGPLPPLPGLP